VKTGISIGKNKGHVTTKREIPRSKAFKKQAKPQKGITVVKDIIREVRCARTARAA
jgi:hypothetical protein